MKAKPIPTALVLIGMLVFACAPDAGHPSTSIVAEPDPSNASDSTQALVPEPDPDGGTGFIDWDDPSLVVERGAGWTIGACIGDGLFLCVERDGAPVGGVEALFYPLASFDFIDLDGRPETQLRAVADAFLTSFQTDRATTCGADYQFEPLTPTSFDLGGHTGLAYSFMGTMADGTPSELILQYSTVTEDHLLLVVAIGEDEGGCLGRTDLGGFTTLDLEEFRPHLEAVLRSSPLPRARS